MIQESQQEMNYLIEQNNILLDNSLIIMIIISILIGSIIIPIYYIMKLVI